MNHWRNFRSAAPQAVALWLNRRQPSQTIVLGGAAVLVGVLSGAGVWAFKQMISLVDAFMFGSAGSWLAQFGSWTVLLLPVTGGLVVGWLMHHFIGAERHHGVAGIMEAEALAGGRLRYQRIPLKTIAAALAIGSGASVGPEDPSVQVGANIGSFFGQTLKLSENWTRALVAAGAAGGIAAAFNAPIAGIFFAMEIILGEFSSSAFGVVVLASVISAVFTQAVSGPEPAFPVPVYEFRSVRELPFYLGLGLAAGPISALYIILLDRVREFFHGLRLPDWARTALAGLLVGLVGIFLPQVFGVGYNTIGNILQGKSTQINLLLILMLAKLVLTPISVGGGFPGGVFAPALFLGATLGGAYGAVVDKIAPSLALNPPAFAMVGMAAVLAGAVRAPLTAILLLFEMTNDYRIILPLMLSVVVSLWIASRIQPDSVYTLALARKGIHLEHGLDVEILEHITVSEVMLPVSVVVNERDTLGKASATITQAHQHGLSVVNGAGDLVGILTMEDIERSQAETVPWQRLVGEVMTRDVLTVTPQDSIRTAMLRMGTRNIGRLPVVSPDNPRKLVGVLRREELVTAYNLALVKRAAARHRAGQVRLGAISRLEVEEVVIQPGAPCDGKRVKEITWPQECVIASLRRGRNIFIPHGNTLLPSGDVLVAVAQGAAREDLARLCRKPEPVLGLTGENRDHH